MGAPVQTTLARLAALRAAIDQRIAREIRGTGKSWSRTNGMIAEYVQVREELRRDPSGAFADIPRRTWSTSIASQREALKDVRSEADYVLTLAAQLNLFRPVDLPFPVAAEERSTGSSAWLREHITQVLIAVLVAYIVFRLGWN